MTTEEKILDSQQIALPLPDSIGITQSSGLDRHCVFSQQRSEYGGLELTAEAARFYTSGRARFTPPGGHILQ